MLLFQEKLNIKLIFNEEYFMAFNKTDYLIKFETFYDALF